MGTAVASGNTAGNRADHVCVTPNRRIIIPKYIFLIGLDTVYIGIDNLGLGKRGFKFLSMAKNEMLPGTLGMLILRVLQPGPIHGYAIAQRIHTLSKELLQVEEGSLYPALQKMLLKGWVKAEWGISETNRKVRFYKLTAEGRKQLQSEIEDFDRILQGIRSVMSRA